MNELDPLVGATIEAAALRLENAVLVQITALREEVRNMFSQEASSLRSDLERAKRDIDAIGVAQREEAARKRGWLDVAGLLKFAGGGASLGVAVKVLEMLSQ